MLSVRPHSVSFRYINSVLTKTLQAISFFLQDAYSYSCGWNNVLLLLPIRLDVGVRQCCGVIMSREPGKSSEE